jgi:hypothetical protein
MDYQYSREYDAAAASELGCWSILPLRIHKNEQIAVDASYEFLADWEKVVGRAASKGAEDTICLCSNGHFVAVTIPECLPERLRIVTRLSDFSYVYDGTYSLPSQHSIQVILIMLDLTETLTAKEGNNSVAEFNLAAQSSVELQQTTKKKQLQAGLMLEMMEIDKYLANQVLQSWGDYYKSMFRPYNFSLGMRIKHRLIFTDTMTRDQPDFKTIDEFIPWRLDNAGV